MPFGKLRLGLGFGFDDGPALPPTDIVWGGSHSTPEDTALGTVLGSALTATDPGGLSVTYSLADDSNGYFSISGTSVIVSRVLDYETATSHNITIRVTNAGGSYYDEVFAVTVTNVSETPPADPIPEPLVIEDDGTFTNPPIATEVDGSVKIHGKKGGVLGKFIYDVGAPEANTIYTMHYDPDFSLLTNTGKEAMVGFVFKQGNDFHLVGLKGDASTGLDAFQLSGDNKWNTGVGLTTDNGGDAAFGTQAGPNWIQIEIAGDGSTYTFRTSSDGSSWTDEYTDEIPAPFGDATDATQFGMGAAFWPDDVGNFSISITSWIWGPAVLGPPLDGLTGITAAWSLNRDMLTANPTPTKYNNTSGKVSFIHDHLGSADRDWVDGGTETRRPTIATVGSLTVADFDGTSDTLNTNGCAAVHLFSASSSMICIACIIDAYVNNSATISSNDCLLVNESGTVGLHARNTGGGIVYGFNWDGDADNVPSQVVPTGVPVVLHVRHHGGVVYMGLNGVEVSGTSGDNTFLLTGMHLGGRAATTPFANFKFFEGFTCNTGNQNFIPAIQNMMAYIGA